MRLPNHSLRGCSLVLVAAGGLAGPARAQVVIDDKLTGVASSYDWLALGGACLTAGNNTGSIPACVGHPTYRGKVQVGGNRDTGRLPDLPGQGALRLTNGDFQIGGSNGDRTNGAVVSDFTYPSHQGLEVTFTTVTYGGDGYSRAGQAATGADGMSFFLMNGNLTSNELEGALGAWGGSLGYSCANLKDLPDGLRRAYIGVGIDEYGNFANPADNTATGPGFRPGHISLRAAGDVHWESLRQHPKYKVYYSDSRQRAEAVRKTCATGLVHNFSGGTIGGVPNGAATGIAIPNYRLLEQPHELPDGVNLSNQQGVARPLRSLAKPVSYTLKITQNGLLSFSYSVDNGFPQQVLTDHPISEDQSSAPPPTFRFGFAASTGSGSNVHEITCFKAKPLEQSQSSAGTNVQQSARVEAGTQVFLSLYHPVNWWGELKAHSLQVEQDGGAVSIGPAQWNAHCTLTGGDCEATGRSQPAQDPAGRRILTWNGSRGVPLRWEWLTAAQRTTLAAGDTAAGQQRLQYLRGDRSAEIERGGALRTRQGVLGDIVNSGPTWVGPPASRYTGAWRDALHPAAAMPEQRGEPYATFQRNLATRQNVVYVGANDGLLHGFRAGAYDAAGRFVDNPAQPNDGQEVLAYMPAAALKTLHSSTSSLAYTSPKYSHNFYVDATPGTGDLFYGGRWHTWLVGGLGAGGNAGGPVAGKTATALGALFALDITDPVGFSESRADALVVGEWTSDTLACSNVAGCGQQLGSTFGTPAIRRLHNGQWAVLFGNGLNSSGGSAGLFIMLVDPATGATSFRFIDTGHGPARDPAGGSARNGIAYVTPADLDGDHITDYVYGGDAFGNLWRFDLTAADPAAWRVSAQPLFSTGGAPITTRIAVASVPAAGGSQPRVVLGFGSGRQMVQTLTSGTTYAEGSHALYGVWDWNLADWNLKAAAAARYAALAAPQAVTPADLQAQSVLATVAGSGAVSGYRTVSRDKVCWKGSSACASGNTRFGWKLPLPGAREQVIYNPVIAYGMLLVNTTIPEVSLPLTCDSAPAWGYTMAVTLADGGAASASFFADAHGDFATHNGQFVSGIGVGAVGSPSIVTTDSRPFLPMQTTKGTPTVVEINPAAGGAGGRVTWLELR